MFAPHQIGVRGIGQTTGDGLIHARLHAVEPFGGALAGEELLVPFVDIAHQETGAERIGAGDDQA